MRGPIHAHAPVSTWILLGCACRKRHPATGSNPINIMNNTERRSTRAMEAHDRLWRANELSRHPSSRARWYHRGWRTPLPRRKSTNPLANSCGREATLLTSNRSRTRAGPTKYPPRALVNRPTLIAAVMAVLPSRLGRAACPSEIAVIEPPI